MTKSEIADAVECAVKSGNWIIRADNDGVSYNGFKWNGVGEWTEAPDWNEEPECGGGLHGQDINHGGYITTGSRLVFCDTEGKHIPIESDKVKVRWARILLVNELPDCLETINGNLNLHGTQITDFGGLKSVGGNLDLRDTQITDIPVNLRVGEKIYR